MMVTPRRARQTARLEADRFADGRRIRQGGCCSGCPRRVRVIAPRARTPPTATSPAAWTPPIATRPTALTPPIATRPTAFAPPIATRPNAFTPPTARTPRALIPPKAMVFAALPGRAVSQVGRAMRLWYHARVGGHNFRPVWEGSRSGRGAPLRRAPHPRPLPQGEGVGPPSRVRSALAGSAWGRGGAAPTERNSEGGWVGRAARSARSLRRPPGTSPRGRYDRSRRA